MAADIIGLVDDQGSTPHGSSDRQNCPYLGLHDLEEGCTHTFFLTLEIAVLASIIVGLCFVNTRRVSGLRKIHRIFSVSLFIMTFLTAALALLFRGTMPVGEHSLPTDIATLGTVETAVSQTLVFTVPASADVGQNIIPNIKDPEAADPQKICPGYKASNIQETSRGFTADLSLAGPPCNVYGNDIESLSLLVAFQENERLRIRIQPRYISPENQTWFLLPEELVPRPPDGEGTGVSSSHFKLSWSNDPSFSFTVKRSDTGDTLFTTEGKALVYEDQFIEFGSSLPENYNLYGLGEVVHGFRLGNNLTSTFRVSALCGHCINVLTGTLFAADVGDVVNANLYGSHPVYLDTRYFAKNASGDLAYVADATDRDVRYVSYTHGVFFRNAHAQDILLRLDGITWRALGGSLDLYFYSGPSAEDVTKAYQHSAVGLPAMQQYWTLGFHQCRWGYQNWTRMQEVVDNFAKFEIPLETIWGKSSRAAKSIRENAC